MAPSWTIGKTQKSPAKSPNQKWFTAVAARRGALTSINSSDVPQSRQSDFRSRVSGQALQGEGCHWGYCMVEWAVLVSCSLVHSRCNMVCDSLTHESFCAHSEYQQQQKQQQLQSTENRSMSKLLIWKLLDMMLVPNCTFNIFRSRNLIVRQILVLNSPTWTREAKVTDSIKVLNISTGEK